MAGALFGQLREFARRIEEGWSGDASRRYVLIGYGKGATDILEALRRSLASIAAVVGLVVLWQLMTMAFNVPNWLLPAPTAIWAEFLKQAHLLGRHAVTTGTGAVSGLAIGTASALILAILMVQSRVLQRILMPLLVIDQSVPKLALAPIFVIWFGTGMMTRVVIAVVISFFPIIDLT